MISIDGTAPPLAATDNATTPLGTVTVGGVVTAVDFLPAATITGNGGRTLTLVKGTTVIVARLVLAAAVDLDDLAPGMDASPGSDPGPGEVLAAGVYERVPLTGDVRVAPGDLLSWQSTHAGSGLADPGGYVWVGVQ
ncbi:hypothetical protein Acsp06_41520 [Actinomycetospora sp. NBRC 106375]|uniref:hypothetical protein n=1 Tax=Actinomycetospora sp. NBRC 106375 TaxID=3032207 RepID=UPI0024A42F46|nr:hypothetical protein [Actinomycetospora sp. NBRC 106375]GLZ47967.1 hypothetical protein Acsp06_41520 [Actinomycetospora sp. NBRC 106375]